MTVMARRGWSAVSVETARRVGTTVVAAGGAATVLGALGLGVLFGQAFIARRIIPIAQAPPPRCDGEYGPDDEEYGPDDGQYRLGHDDYGPDAPAAPALRLAVIGDSTAAGYGVHSPAETPGALLATWIARAARRPVRLTCTAFVGSVSAWLAPQVATAVESGVDLAIIFIGANDVTSRARESAAIQHLEEAVQDLRAAGAEVIVATCPDLGTIRPIYPPLRWLTRRWSRQLAAAQTVATVRAGGRAVSLGDLLGPRFAAVPELMFGDDRYHPSAEGYRVAAQAVLPAALAALGLAAAPVPPPVVLPLDEAATAAAAHPGSQVSADPTGSTARSGRAAVALRVRRLVRGLRPRLAPAGAQRRGLAVPSVVARVARSSRRRGRLRWVPSWGG